MNTQNGKKPLITMGVFIDGANFYHDLQRLGVKRIDYEKLLKYLACCLPSRRGVFTQLWFFTGEPKAKKGEAPEVSRENLSKFKKFKNYLESLGFEVMTKEVKYVYDKCTGKCVDQKCDLDPKIINVIENIVDQKIGIPEIIFFFSGDSDFEESIERLQKAKGIHQLSMKEIALKTKVVVASSWEGLSYELRKKADGIIYLTNNKTERRRQEK